MPLLDPLWLFVRERLALRIPPLAILLSKAVEAISGMEVQWVMVEVGTFLQAITMFWAFSCQRSATHHCRILPLCEYCVTLFSTGEFFRTQFGVLLRRLEEIFEQEVAQI